MFGLGRRMPWKWISSWGRESKTDCGRSLRGWKGQAQIFSPKQICKQLVVTNFTPLYSAGMTPSISVIHKESGAQFTAEILNFHSPGTPQTYIAQLILHRLCRIPPHSSTGFRVRRDFQVHPFINPLCLSALTRNSTLFSGLFPRVMQAAELEQNNVPINTAKDTSLPLTTWLVFFSPITFLLITLFIYFKKKLSYSKPK